MVVGEVQREMVVLPRVIKLFVLFLGCGVGVVLAELVLDVDVAQCSEVFREFFLVEF